MIECHRWQCQMPLLRLPGSAHRTVLRLLRSPPPAMSIGSHSVAEPMLRVLRG